MSYSFANLSHSVGNTVRAYSPGILLGISFAGFITSTILAVTATPKAIEQIKKDSAENHDGDENAYTVGEAIKSGVKHYIPSMMAIAVGFAAGLKSYSISSGRVAAFATAYSISEMARKEYEKAAKEVVGEKKEKEIQDQVARNISDKSPCRGDYDIVLTGHGNTLCIESITGQRFRMDIEYLHRLENGVRGLNDRLKNEMQITLNEWLSDLKIHHSSIGDKVGFDLSNGFVDFRHSSIIDDQTEEPAYVISYDRVDALTDYTQLQ